MYKLILTHKTDGTSITLFVSDSTADRLKNSDETYSFNGLLEYEDNVSHYQSIQFDGETYDFSLKKCSLEDVPGY